MTDITDELIDLQTRLAYQEDAIHQLNLVITKQDADVLQLQQQIRMLAKRLDELALLSPEGESDITMERPPHY